jgi:hypothetical protein
MSNYERHRGTLTIVRPDLTPEEFAELIYDSIPGYCENKLEHLLDDDRYLIHQNNIYLISDNALDDIDEWYIAKTKIETLEIDYDVKFYNGGCGLKEALNSAIDNIDKEHL